MSEGDVRYRFLSVVGVGGFGKVYRARLETNQGFHKDVAVKLLSDEHPPPALLKRFRDEAKILGRVRDRAIVGVEPPIMVGNQWAVVMDFVDGVSAGALLLDSPLPLGVAVEIVGEIARALHNAFHMQTEEGPLELLHRDIKPDNIQVTPSGDIRLLDFGIAKANFAAREFQTRMSLGGTPGYIAPERLQRVEVPEGDVYSLGVVLHELITAHRPRFSPTVHIGDIEGNSPTFGAQPVGSEGVVVDASDLEVDEALKEDADVMKVLTLAGWMRCHDHESRPSSRQVEEACRRLRQQLPAPFLRDWAEDNVPHRHELAPDDLVGQVLATTGNNLVRDRPPTSATATPAPSLPPPPVRDPVTLGAGIVAGGAAVSAIGLGVLLVIGIGGLLWTLTRPPFSEEVTSAAGTEVVGVAPEPVPVVDPEPAPEADPEPVPMADPAPVRPSPAPVQDETVVISLPGTSRSGTAPPVVDRPRRSVRTLPKGMLALRTVPPGATVRVKGEVLQKTGDRYVLPAGDHTLKLEAPGGESTRLPVTVTADETVTICYSFHFNAPCTE